MTNKITQSQRLLMRRMVEQDLKRYERQNNDDSFALPATKLITAIAALNWAMFDLIEELDSAGLYKHSVKRNINRAHHIVEITHSHAYSVISRTSKILDPKVVEQAKRQFNDAMKDTYDSVVSCISLDGLEKSYNIVLALNSIIIELKNEIDSKYYAINTDRMREVGKLVNLDFVKNYKVENIVKLNIFQ